MCVVEGKGRRRGFWKQVSKALSCQQVQLRGGPGALGLGLLGIAAGTSRKGLGTNSSGPQPEVTVPGNHHA